MTMFKVEELEAGPLLDQAVLLAMGATRMVDAPDGVPNNVRERWPDGGCLVLTDGPNMAFYGAAPPFSTDWGIGGPALIDKARLSLIADGDYWSAGDDSESLAKSFILRDLVKRQIVMETEDAPTRLMEANRKALAREYEAFTDADDGREDVGAPKSALVVLCRTFVASKVGPTIELRQPAWNVGTPTVTQGPPPLDQLHALK